ncbi:glycosyltransferase [Pseudomonas kuykendallii]|uniref:Glycosyltransferase, MGT family n=1 Tax=Pseudomonas kuykendallii TaxID=1007099 RepID=A0A1H2ZQF6_9PSED|nr:glycosyltransferase [Pseudomonas kuykendallii]MCQ4271989.1 glycosyltransferase [Pseudomonas kuykendallii]SDX19626.1 glycosyltransferase, MGT family [Pseudomonas kuykendallii]
MSHFAVIAPPFTSHFRALEALAGSLIARGHRVTFVHQQDAGALLRDPRVGFASVGAVSHPVGSLRHTVALAARPGGVNGLRRVILDLARTTDMLCREAPAVLRELGVDALLADQMEAAGGLIAEHLKLPYVSIACALPVNREPRLPLPVMPWGYADSPQGENLNRGSSQVYDLLMRPHARVIAGHAERFGLAPRQALHECLSPYAQISQTTAAFDFPRQQAPAQFHAVGPLRGAEEEAPLQIPLATRRPFVFASLGTLQGGRFGLFQRIVRACAEQDVQLLLAHCGGLNTVQERVLEGLGATWVTDFAPQRAALARADAVITHAGLNTVMDALAAGVPMLAVPIAFDQPGVAARVLHAGAGLRLFPQLASRSGIGRTLRQLLDEPRFAANAARVGASLAQAGGVERAADIVEAVVRSGQPVERADAT